MRTSLAAALVIVVLAVAALAYLLINQEIREAPEIALSNAKKLLLSENFTGTYYVTVTTQVNSRASTLSGISTTSRSPSINALVSNSTGLLMEFDGRVVHVNSTVVVWMHGDEVCQVLISISNASPYNRTATFCIPSNYSKYLLPFYVDEELLGNATYIGESSWNGETTYCFKSEITVSQPSITTGKTTTIGSPVTTVINATRLCILSNGVTASATLYETSRLRHQSFATVINETLISYSFTFNQQLFSQITSRAGLG